MICSIKYELCLQDSLQVVSISNGNACTCPLHAADGSLLIISWKGKLWHSFCLLQNYIVTCRSKLGFYCSIFGLVVWGFLVTKPQVLLNLPWFAEGGYLVFLRGQTPLSQTLCSYLPLTYDNLGHLYRIKNFGKRTIIQHTGHLRKNVSLQTNRWSTTQILLFMQSAFSCIRN